MKKFAFTTIFILILCFSVFAQTPTNSNCPEIKVTGPSSTVRPGENMTFTANVSGVGRDKIEYSWSIDKGTIVEGQGTPVIAVDTTGLGSTMLTATVEIEGLPAGCSGTASETGKVDCGGHPMTFDEYRKLSIKNEKMRLSALAARLKEISYFTAYIILYHPADEQNNSSETRAARIKDFLLKDKNIPAERVVVVFGGEEAEELTRIFLVPPCPIPKNLPENP